MKGLTNQKNIIVVFAMSAALLLSTSLSHAQRFSAWFETQNMGAMLNTATIDMHVTISPSGLSLYFSSDRPGGLGGTDIYVSQRATLTSAWGAPQSLGATVNSSGGEGVTSFSLDGLTAFMYSNRPGGMGGFDHYMMTRTDPNNDFGWSAPVPITVINTASADVGSTYFEDPATGAGTLIFHSNRPGGLGAGDFYQSTRNADGTFNAPTPIAELNTTASEERSVIRRDGLQIFISSNRPGSLGMFDIWVSTRASVSAPWNPPVPAAGINTADNEYSPTLSADGKTMYFSSNRAGGVGGMDLYSTRRNIFTPLDLDGDGRSDIRAIRNRSDFHILNSTNNSHSVFSFGGTVATWFLAHPQDDFDGDGKSDLMAFSSVAGGVFTWSIMQSGSNTIRTLQWGLQTDQPRPADYDGDGKTDIAVYRGSEGIWYILLSTTNQMRAEYWGQAPNDIAALGDFDGDGINDLTVIRPSTGIGSPMTWFTRRSSDGTMLVDHWGGGVMGATDSPFPGIHIDVDGDGIRDRMVMRDPNSTTTGDQTTCFIQRSSDRSMLALPWGLDTDGRAFGDYDGDGKTDFVARRNISGQLTWFILLSSTNYNPAQARIVYWGITGDI